MDVEFYQLPTQPSDTLTEEIAVIFTDHKGKLPGNNDGLSKKRNNMLLSRGRQFYDFPKLNKSFHIIYEDILYLIQALPSDLNRGAYETAGITVANTIRKLTQNHDITVRVDSNDLSNEQILWLLSGMALGNYQFDDYKTDNSKRPGKIKNIRTYNSQHSVLTNQWVDYNACVHGVELCRDLVNASARHLYPEAFVAQLDELKSLGIKMTVYGEKKLEKMGFDSLLSVGKGSAKESQVVVMEWNSNSKSQDTYAFVGKGVTFDSGGISIKPSPGMEDMKMDMSGAAAVCGLMKTLALRKATQKVVGVIGLCENMPDGNAYKPGDIIPSLSGKTIEVQNTDAEGRLILADLLYYTNTTFKPHYLVNLATLTGAIVISLGGEYAGLFSNNDNLAKLLINAGEESQEKLWRLPLHKNYLKALDSSFADLRNIGDRGASSTTAALFLQHFVDTDLNNNADNNETTPTPWAHLDIAGVAWGEKSTFLANKSATGYGVRLLDLFLKNISTNDE